jgi:hypothetical protein
MNISDTKPRVRLSGKGNRSHPCYGNSLAWRLEIAHAFVSLAPNI